MKTNTLFFRTIIVIGMFMFLLACEKDNNDNFIDETSDISLTIEDDEMVSGLFDYLFDEAEESIMILEAGQLDGNILKSGKGGKDECEPVRTIEPEDPEAWPKTITIDFGDENCIDRDGNTRRGKIIITLTDKPRTPGSQKIVEPEGLFINDNQIEGTKTITLNERNENGNRSFTVKLENGKITTPDGKVFERNMLRTREWIAGEDTRFYKFDDEYEITGNTEGVNAEGESYSKVITKPLNLIVGCKWIRSGTVEFTRGDEAPVILDYGDGKCDPKATITKDGETTEIILRRH